MSLRDLKRTLLACPSLKSSSSSSSSSSIGLRKPPRKSSLRDQIASIERLAADFQWTPSGEMLAPQRCPSPSPPPSPPAPPCRRKQHDLDGTAIPNPAPKRTRLSDYSSFLTNGGDPQDFTNTTQRLESDVDSALLPNPAPKRTRLSDYASFLIDGRNPQDLANTTHQRFELDELLQENQDRVDEENEDLVGLPHAVVDSEAGLFIQSQAEGVQEPLVLWPPDGQGSDIVQVPASINSRLLEHQRAGVQFLYSLYRDNKGGVLGDDMGLGKTIQVIAFLSAIFQQSSSVMDGIRHHKLTSNQKPVLIICPTSVLRNWEQEFHAWGNLDVALYHGAQREHVFSRLESRNLEIVLTSFDTFRIHGECLCVVDWDCVIVDEAHRLKNDRSDLYKVCVKIRTKRRYGLTGTIMQNKIMDLFNVFDWVAPGCLGTREHFREFYEEPLKQGQRINAPERFIRVAEQRRLHLARLLQKYLLRREKHDTIGHLMMGKEDNVVFCEMSPLQRRAYKRLLASPDFQCLIRKDEPCTCGSPLTRAECCYRIIPNGIIWPYLHRESSDGCDSCPYCLILPCLTKLQQVSNHLELIKPNVKDEHEKQRKDELLAEFILAEDAALVGGTAQDESFLGLSDAQHCGKMKALEQLLGHWLPQGDKVLLFSYSVRMLDILDKFLIRKGYCFSRLDGSTPMSARQAMVDDFNRSRSKQVFLISTRAGGLGLNLVSANRVVIFDPNWNPAQDLQAQDRSFRYGQRRHVTVYRLLAAGSLEELVYTRQIYKQQLFNIAVSGNLEKRYFEGVQDSKENKGELFGISNLFRDLSEKAFTSEIIESYNMRAQENKQRVNGKGYCVVAGGELFKSSEVGLDSTKITITEARSVKRTSDDELARVLKNAGVVYAHRNEDVVNLKSNSEKSESVKEKGKSASAINPLQPRNSLQMALVDKKLDIRKKVEKSVRPVVRKFGPLEAKKRTHMNTVTTKEEQFGQLVEAKKHTDVKTATTKEEQFALLAASKGMSKTDFCKWLLSASEDEKKCLLLNLNQGKS